VDIKFASVGEYVFVFPEVEWNLGSKRLLIITTIITERGRSQLNEVISSCMIFMTARPVLVQVVLIYGVS